MAIALADFSTDYLEQQDHERMKHWMQEHGWSCAIGADPADIYEILEAYDADSDDNDDEENDINRL
jgi:hypothetical protein